MDYLLRILKGNISTDCLYHEEIGYYEQLCIYKLENIGEVEKTFWETIMPTPRNLISVLQKLSVF